MASEDEQEENRPSELSTAAEEGREGKGGKKGREGKGREAQLASSGSWVGLVVLGLVLDPAWVRRKLGEGQSVAARLRTEERTNERRGRHA